MKALHLKPVSKPDQMKSYWKKEWFTVTMIILTGTIFNASLSFVPILQGRIIDQMIARNPFSVIIRSILFFVLAIGAIQFARYLKRYYVRVFANRTSASMRMMVYNHILHKDMASLKGEKAGDLMNKAISDVNACVEGMRKFTTEIFDTGVLMISYFITMLLYDVHLTLLACIGIMGAMLLAESLKKIIYKYTKNYRSAMDKVSVMTYETAENAMLYRMYSAEETNLKHYNTELASLEKKAVLANLFESSMQPVYNAVATLGVLFIVYLGGMKVINTTWTIGEFSAYLSIFIALSVKAGKAAKLFNSVQKAKISWGRIKPYLTPYVQDGSNALPPSSPIYLQLSGVSFCYPDADTPILKDLSFKATGGQLIGITGSVASGKSSLGLLLLGLYDYTGSLLINGKELRDYSDLERSSLISYMGHDSQLFTTTISENILLGAPDNDLGLQKVLHTVCFEEDLKTMPDGTKTIVGASGVRLSGGQQARLSLARTLYHKPPILILDDPFSAVDAATEGFILNSLREEYSDCLILLISHRLSCFPTADQVLLIDHGTCYSGTHQSLLDSSEKYRELFETHTSEDCATKSQKGGSHA